MHGFVVLRRKLPPILRNLEGKKLDLCPCPISMGSLDLDSLVNLSIKWKRVKEESEKWVEGFL